MKTNQSVKQKTTFVSKCNDIDILLTPMQTNTGRNLPNTSTNPTEKTTWNLHETYVNMYWKKPTWNLHETREACVKTSKEHSAYCYGP